MKRFEVPTLSIQKLDTDGVIYTSGCFVEAVACIECYASAAECPVAFTCTELVCPTLDDID